MKKQIYMLPEGTRIKLLSLHEADAHYEIRKNLINKEYEAFVSEQYSCTAFRQEVTNKIYVFSYGATYKKIKKEPT